MSVYNNKEKLELIVANSSNYVDCMRKYGQTRGGNNWKTLQKYIKLFNIDSSHFSKKKNISNNLGRGYKMSFDKILVENSPYTNTTSLKVKLLEAELIKEECDICKCLPLWNNKRLVLHLDHRNGINNDNRRENLRLLCPNCHSQTDTYCNKKLGLKVSEKVKILNNSLKEAKINELKNKILEANLDYSIKNWGVQAAIILNMTPASALRWVKRYILSHGVTG